ncbi:MAG: hypothetical protein ACYTFV_12475, partial [Planctomycetota bacterium]
MRIRTSIHSGLLLTLGAASACASTAPASVVELSTGPRSSSGLDVDRPGLPQEPAIDDSGRWVTFAHAGDIWIVEAEGGVATRLTAHPAEERRSAFSPDGSLIAFESDRDGSRNLYTMPLTEV